MRPSRPVDVSLMLEHHAYYLAEISPDGRITSLDGGHDEPEGVTRAKTLYDRLGLTREDHRYVMLHSAPIPDFPVEINEETVRDCRMMLDLFQPDVSPLPPPPPQKYEDMK